MFKSKDATWAANPAKVERAIKSLKTQGLPITEKVVKELYLQYGGAVIGQKDTYVGTTEVTEEFFEGTAQVKEFLAEKEHDHRTTEQEETA